MPADFTEFSNPEVHEIGLDGVVVRFDDRLNDGANRAAIAFINLVDSANLQGLEETSAALTSVYLRFDAEMISPAEFIQKLNPLLRQVGDGLKSRAQPKRRWTIPIALGGAEGPQFEDAAEADSTFG